MSYQNLLEEEYQSQKESSCPPENKLQFIGEYIFSFRTYDDEITELLAKKMLEVLQQILNKTTFSYLENQENYLNYLTMVNMSFLKDKLDCGTSIRGAWISPDSLIGVYKFIGFSIPKKDISNFLSDLLLWYEI